MLILEKNEISRFTFSGHDSFQCRQLWLKKGYDYIQDQKSFNDEDAIVQLGVGKNMVSSIRFWLKAFNVIDNKEIPTEFGKRIFDNENGFTAKKMSDPQSLAEALISASLIKSIPSDIAMTVGDYTYNKYIKSWEVAIS